MIGPFPPAGAASGSLRSASAYRSIPDLWLHRVTSTPDTEAFRTLLDGKYRVVTWASAARTAAALAHGLRAIGVSPGDRCLVLTEPRAEAFLFDAAAWLAGAVVTADDPRAPDADWKARCAATGAVVLAASGPAAVRAARLRLPGVRVVSFDPVDAPDILPLGALEHAGDGFDALVDAVAAGQDATVTFTAGTTGPPRPAVHTHEAWVAMAQMIESARLLRPTDQILTSLPWDHPAMRALEVAIVRLGIPTACVSAPTLAAAQLAAPSVIAGLPHTFEALADELLDAIDEEAPAVVRWVLAAARRRVPRSPPRSFVPRMAIASLSRAERLALAAVRARLGPRMRVGICAGAPVAPEVAELFSALGVPILSVWGTAEAGGIVCASRRDDPRLDTVGPPLPGAHVAVGPGGALRVASPAYMRADPDPDGLFPTGDDGEVRPDGEVVWRGRRLGPKGLFELQDRIAAACPWAEHVVVHGEQALITARPEAVEAWANDRGVPYVALADLVRRPEVQSELRAMVAPVLADAPPELRVRRTELLPERFTRENGLLGPSLAVRRAAVAERFATRR